jgi:hypothetical protein
VVTSEDCICGVIAFGLLVTAGGWLILSQEEVLVVENATGLFEELECSLEP